MTTPEVPRPTLTYRVFDEEYDPRGIVGEGSPLFRVHEVSASFSSFRGFSVYARGSMRKRDGTRGPSRGVRIDTTARQPEWLAAIMSDAQDRLAR